MWHENILGTIGSTPLVRVNRLAADLPCTVLAKLEYFNPGSSVKDRIGIAMVEAAETSGDLKPGGTIIEGTSGNTGAGLALAAIVRGYRCIFTTTDKQSPEKIAVLRALGAEVIVCPTAVAPEDPRSYYSVASRLATEVPNSVHVNQYENPANAAAHFDTSGPEIWEQTGGRVTHLIAGAGTGGTISGTARFLKEKNPEVKVIGVDPHGSVYFKYFHTREFDEGEIHPYVTEGVGEDILAGNMDFDIVDDFVRVTDREAMITTRRLCREEGVFAGGSSGMALAGALQWLRARRDSLTGEEVVVVLLPDGGFRYLGKIYNDAWMRDHGFLEEKEPLTAEAVLASIEPRALPGGGLVSVTADMTLGEAIDLMTGHGISQVPVFENGEVVGSLVERGILGRLIREPDARARQVRDVMGEPFPIVQASTPIRDLAGHLQGQCTAVLVRSRDGGLSILTRTDLISSLGA